VSEVPSAWVVRFSPLIAAGARVLDIACGYGRHARFLASRGVNVTAVDRDPAALAALEGIAGVDRIAADLEGAPWPFEEASFDAIVVTNYLHRPLFTPIGKSIKAGGLLLYETFMTGHERFGRPSNPDFLLRPRELLTVFAALHVIAFEQGVDEQPVPRVVQRIAASVRDDAQGGITLPPPV
jgi:SAM-dependent methyltransferase